MVSWASMAQGTRMARMVVVVCFSAIPGDSLRAQQDCPEPLQCAINSTQVDKETFVLIAPSAGSR